MDIRAYYTRLVSLFPIESLQLIQGHTRFDSFEFLPQYTFSAIRVV